MGAVRFHMKADVLQKPARCIKCTSIDESLRPSAAEAPQLRPVMADEMPPKHRSMA